MAEIIRIFNDLSVCSLMVMKLNKPLNFVLKRSFWDEQSSKAKSNVLAAGSWWRWPRMGLEPSKALSKSHRTRNERMLGVCFHRHLRFLGFRAWNSDFIRKESSPKLRPISTVSVRDQRSMYASRLWTLYWASIDRFIETRPSPVHGLNNQSEL